METRCTCGAVLVADALFCHRCGRPTREDLVEPPPLPESSEPAASPIIIEVRTPPREEARIDLRNTLALRVGIISAVLIYLGLTLVGLLMGPVLLPVVQLGGGLYSVMLYQRRSGLSLSVLNGARLGWITGLFSFLIVLVIIALVALVANNPEFMRNLEESSRAMGVDQATASSLSNAFTKPSFLVGMVAFQFLFLTVLCSLGGALGARLFRRD